MNVGELLTNEEKGWKIRKDPFSELNHKEEAKPINKGVKRKSKETKKA